jgi:hypothetical protein
MQIYLVRFPLGFFVFLLFFLVFPPVLGDDVIGTLALSIVGLLFGEVLLSKALCEKESKNLGDLIIDLVTYNVDGNDVSSGRLTGCLNFIIILHIHHIFFIHHHHFYI